MIDEEIFAEGTMFDGSSIAGWKAINESDMLLMPDPTTATMDPFFSAPTMVINCDVLEPGTGEPYNRDPRGIAKKAEAYLKSTGIGDTVYVGPEAEFFIFDDVKIGRPLQHRFPARRRRAADQRHDRLRGRQSRPPHRHQGRLLPRPAAGFGAGHARRDAGRDAVDGRGRREAPSRGRLGPARARHEVRHARAHRRPDADLQVRDPQRRPELRQDGDLHAEAVYGDNGSGMHVHQSIWKNGKPVFAGNKYADLSQECLWYIGGIIKHAKSLNAFTNPSTNSYKRLVPGYEAPVLLAYSARNRSASCRIPWTTSPKAKRVEVRFPDPMANPYLAFAAMLMAGLDGIVNKIDPGPAMDKDLYDLPPRELKKIPTVCGSLREALESLKKDNAYLKAGGVFNDDFIDSYIELKMQDVARFEMTPHPVEFAMYYSY
jgi:glutamine synthetase